MLSLRDKHETFKLEIPSNKKLPRNFGEMKNQWIFYFHCLIHEDLIYCLFFPSFIFLFVANPRSQRTTSGGSKIPLAAGEIGVIMYEVEKRESWV
ncbi:MAG: hypothetical protein ACRD5B_19520, partial [Nitrososphaeraceae archaeon]